MLKPKRATRQQIKEDKLITFTANASKFYSRNSRNILAGAGIVVVIALVVAFFLNSRAQAEKEATYELTMAKIEIGQRNYDTAADKLSQIIDNFSGTRSAGDALFFLGNVYLFQEEWAKAQSTFQQYLKNYGRDPQLTAASLAGLGFAAESEKKYQEAADYYLEAANKYPREYNAPQYLLDAGRCFIFADDTSRARSAYNSIVERYKDSNQKQQAEDELNRW